MRRTLALLIAATLAAGAPVAALAQDRDRDDRRERREERREDRRDERPRRPLSDSVPPNCRYSRDLPDGRKVFRCEVEPGRYIDRVF